MPEGYAKAILVQKLALMDQGNQSFAEDRFLTHTLTEEVWNTGTYGLLRHVCKERGELLNRRDFNTIVLCGSYQEEGAGVQGKLLGERAELSSGEVRFRSSPVIVDLPQGLGSEGRKCEPVVEFVLLEVSKGNKQESRQGRGVVVFDDAVPNLRHKSIKNDDPLTWVVQMW
jgi:hypothetical protein